MATRSYLNPKGPKADEHSADGRLKVITNYDWKNRDSGPSITFWLHTGAPGEPALEPTHRAVATFPTMVEYTRDTGEKVSFLKHGYLYINPDDVRTSLGQKRFVPKKAPDTFPFWYTAYKSTVPTYDAVSPHWRAWHWIADQIVDGQMDPLDAIFHFSWRDRDQKAMEATWTAMSCVGKPMYKEYDYRCCLAPRYESVIPVLDDDNLDAGIQLLITSSMIAGGLPLKSPRVPGFDSSFGKIDMAITADRRDVDAANERLMKAGKKPVDISLCDPYDSPYPFRLEFDGSRPNPGDTYSISSLRKDTGPTGAYEFTDQIRAALETALSPADMEHVLVPGDGDFDNLYGAMRSAADAANCTKFLAVQDELFAPWAARLGIEATNGQSMTGASGKAPTESSKFCGCGCGVEDSWSECPNCREPLTGRMVPPSLDALAHNGGTQKCTSCGEVTRLDSGSCPGCNAELPIQLYGQDTGFVVDDDDDLPY